MPTHRVTVTQYLHTILPAVFHHDMGQALKNVC